MDVLVRGSIIPVFTAAQNQRISEARPEEKNE